MFIGESILPLAIKSEFQSAYTEVTHYNLPSISL